MKRLRTVTLASTLLLAACGGEVAVGRGPDRARTFPSEVDTLTPDLRLGSASGPAEEAFAGIADIEVGPDGTLYILDQLARTIRVFGPDGRFVRSIGRQGEGPGEFRFPLGLALAPAGTLWVFDDLARAILVLDPDGREISRHDASPSGARGSPAGLDWDGVFAPDGRLIQTVQHAEPLPGGSMGVLETRLGLFVRRLDPESGVVDSIDLGEMSLRRYRVRTTGPNGRAGVLLGAVPFDPRVLVAVDGEGNVWRALSTEYALERTSPAGDSLTLQAEVGEVPWSSEQRAVWQEMVDERELGIEVPDRVHLLARLFTDDEQRLWVQRYTGREVAERFDVFDMNGDVSGSVMVPGLRPFMPAIVRAGRLYTVLVDELGVASVIRAPLPNLR